MWDRWRQISSTVYRLGRRAFPFLVSVSLVSWLVWSVTPGKLLWALSNTNWPWLLFATLVQLVVLFLWDTICLWWLFSQPHRDLPFRMILRVRTDTILWSAINLEIGQGAFAWKLARLRNEPVVRALGRCVLLGLFDFGTLTSLGLVCSFLRPNRLVWYLRWVCLGSVLGVGVLCVLLKFLPQHWRQWLMSKQWGSWLAWWDWRRSVVLWALRLVLFLLVIGYAWWGLVICRIPVDARTVFGTIPFVILAEALPGTGGLGEREASLLYLLDPPEEQRAVVLSFGLIWSTVIILGRITIGLVSALLPRAETQSTLSQEEPETERQPAATAPG